MKKTLMSLLAGCLTLSSLAGPQELHKKMLQRGAVEDNSPVGKNKYKEEIYSQPQYKTKVCTFSSEPYNAEDESAISNQLTFTVESASTRAYIVDKGANGIEEGDYMVISHDFPSKDALKLRINYQKNNNFSLECDLNIQGENIHYDLQTDDLNPLMQQIVREKTTPIVQWGQQIYSDLVSAAERNVAPQLPYNDLMRALKEVEPLLPAIKDGKKSAGFALLKMSNKYGALAKERVKQ